MENDIRKIKLECNEVLRSWKWLLTWLKETTDETKLLVCLFTEIENDNRAVYIDRIRTRFNKIRAKRELKELEQLSGQKINVNY